MTAKLKIKRLKLGAREHVVTGTSEYFMLFPCDVNQTGSTTTYLIILVQLFQFITVSQIKRKKRNLLQSDSCSLL